MAVSAGHSALDSATAPSADNAYLQHLLATLAHPVAIFDSSMHCVHCNQAFSRLASQDSDIGADRAVADFLPGLSTHLTALVQRCLGDNAVIKDQAIDIGHAADGLRHWRLDITPCNTTTADELSSVLVQLHAAQSEDGAHQAIRAAEARAHRVLDTLFTFVGLMTPDGTVVDANRAPLEAGGISLEDVRGKKIWDTYWFCHDPYLQARIQLSVDAAARGEAGRYDIVVRMKNDTRMPLDFMLAPLRNDDGIITHLVPSAIDISSRTSSEEALRQSEERFRCVVEAAPDGLAMVDRNGCLALVNSGMERMFGYPREELLGQPIEMLIPERYRSRHPGLRGAYMSAPTTRDMAGRRELYALRKDGSEFPVEIGLNALNTVGGEHVLAAIVDVTKRKADEEAVRQSEERFRCVVEAAPDGLAMVDREGRLALVNSGMERMFGYPREELLGQPIEMLIPERYRSRHPGLRGAYMSAPTTRDMAGRRELYALRKDGSEFPVEIGLNALSTVGGEHVLAAIVDVTKRKADEEAMRQSEERFRCVVEAAPDGLAMVDREGRLALVNSGMERLFGFPREELLGQPIEMLIPKRYRSGHPGLRSAYMSAPTTRDMAGRRELYALRKDGSEFSVEIGLNALNTVGGEHVLAAIVDVTKRKADQAILEKALNEKTVLLNEVHHRVKNNLQVVCSLLNLQARTASKDARLVLEDSQKRVKAMALIHQLLYERSDFSSVDIGLYLRRLATLLRELLGEARARVKLEIDTSAADISMDLQRSVPCGLLINELVTNAIKHGFPDGRSGEIRVSTELLSPEQARIVVSDNGIGIPPDIVLGDVSKSLGFQLIPLFADQLGGELRLIRENGSRFELTFKTGMGRD